MDLYTKNALQCSRKTTHNYSTSFSLGVRLLSRKYRMPIHGIYGFVRFADEIVDTFHEHDKKRLLKEFREDTYKAIEDKISTNPILHSFQHVVNKYGIDKEVIDAFLDSMQMDLSHEDYNSKTFKKYVYGSAEVVGLMCLRVFTENDPEEYDRLKEPAMKLGEAFQKINFLRDLRSDYIERSRSYFPQIDPASFSDADKAKIEEDIAIDFNEAYEGIKRLNKDSRLGVFLAYTYYKKLFVKIRQTKAKNIMSKRYRISNTRKMALLFKGYIKHKMNLI
ncbi:Dehydrosqualene synthase [Salinivirga cyanobacteriivorans]|uniref:Dehydrosqualene synthase n=1 Tax=Salinivirga cyanobacteriivorans TaxID=1307839 RepID=A0A0S2HXJ2_9BACT|nr:phytoene/squalene synthase family protein [Salinivirga cyanobacteriivorans]ALO14762.1 Dehydrosqualene synthase [Salinivirga cyanobacteriivorans]